MKSTMPAVPCSVETKEDGGDFSHLCRNDADLGFVDLRSPCGAKPLRYYYVREEIEIDGVLSSNIADLLQASLVGHEKAVEAFKPFAVQAKKSKSVDDVKELVTNYERILEECVEIVQPFVPTRMQPDPLNTVLALVYNRNIEKVRDLNNYVPFSPETYGETTYDFIVKMIDEMNIGENDMFLDLGSGVGNVIIQVAALCHCKKLVGIEIVEARAKFAEKIDREFRSLMAWMGKAYGEYELFHGDFLEKKYRDLILASNVIFCNNYAFTPKLNLQLKVIFGELPEKVRILVSKSLRDEKFRIYDDKTANDPSALLPVRKTFPGEVSWTDSPVTFFLHEVDRTMVEKFFKSRLDPELRAQFEEEQRRNRPNYYESSSEQDSQGIERDRSEPDSTEDDEMERPRRRIATRSQIKKGGRRARNRSITDESDDSEEDERTPSTLSDRSVSSEASSGRTRSIPQEAAPRPSTKRKRGRPPKQANRVAPSSSGSSVKGALQALHKHTVKGIRDVDRSAQPGCAVNSINGAAQDSDDLPEPFRICLKNMENAMREYTKAVRTPGYRDSVGQKLLNMEVEMRCLKSAQERLCKEVGILRGFAYAQMRSIFEQFKMPMPTTAVELQEASRTMLDTNQLLKHRHDTLKDDIFWLKNAQKYSDSDSNNPSVNGNVSLCPTGPAVLNIGAPSVRPTNEKAYPFQQPPVPSAVFFPPSIAPPGSGGRDHKSARDGDHGKKGHPSDAHRKVPRENTDSSSKHSRGFGREAKDSVSRPQSSDHQFREPISPFGDDRVDKFVKSDQKKPPVGNLRGLSPSISTEKSHSAKPSKHGSDRHHSDSSFKEPKETAGSANALPKSANVDPMAAFYRMQPMAYPVGYPDMSGYPAAFGAIGMPGSNGSVRPPMWSQYPIGMFDASQLAASMTASFSAFPGGTGTRNDRHIAQDGPAMAGSNFEAISPPPPPQP
ncbi:histone-lysine N-methyltransferase, H3 lysine-79 specific-like [Paramacrobiotus metropolitanus]|uniref:histone-lysine N-methyltransferase, H3 lysine-79 specific-like n=1 Tax=Paramacrobiotus metropolitanus TaxID=2943436 RepID=UPI002445D4E1|nr:histone-lysine N-methyltransferase, H3 lysine-79 specific-like [Paramacrobiotus metropolitanus]